MSICGLEGRLPHKWKQDRGRSIANFVAQTTILHNGDENHQNLEQHLIESCNKINDNKKDGLNLYAKCISKRTALNCSFGDIERNWLKDITVYCNIRIILYLTGENRIPLPYVTLLSQSLGYSLFQVKYVCS